MASIFLRGVVGAPVQKAGLSWAFQVRVEAPYRGKEAFDWFRCVIADTHKAKHPVLDKLKQGTVVDVSGIPGFCHQSGSFQVRLLDVEIREDTENGT